MRTPTILDLCIPGSGLLVDGRAGSGLGLLVPSVLVLAAVLLALMLGGAIAGWVLPRALPVYALFIAFAQLLRWHYARRTNFDPVRVRELARAAAAAWLRGQEADATTAARQLVRAAPEVPNAWRLLALVSKDARAERRARAIEARIS